ncbi:MAG: GTP-binding protein [Rhodospirillaceae bacterium]|nr:MAG: GTP-binding protein [Rhodospirillaceae bacterium]
MTQTQIPVTVLTGFLGAGKTTLLNRVLTENHGKKYAVIVNEFGEVGIDNDLVVGADEEVFEMNNGCICCTVRGDLIRIIGGLMKRRGGFDGILIETTGLADPSPVAQTFFTDEDVRAKTTLDGIVTVVDAKHVEARLADTDTADDQIAFADVILLNKTDLVTPAELAQVERRIRAINPFAKIHHTARCDIALDKVLDRGAFDLNRALALDPDFLTESHDHHHDHHHEHGHDHHHDHDHDHHEAVETHDEDISSLSLTSDTPLNPNKFNTWINDVLMSQGQSILRTKGIINLTGADKRYVFQAVHMVSEGAFTGAWPASDNRRSRLVFIGRDLDEAALRKGFAACVA